jgi:thiosulfate reductase cytochrome b subunit
MTLKDDYMRKGYTKAEVDILVKLATIETNQTTILKNYVRKDQFEPVQRLVYGLVALVLIAVMSGLIALVLQ